MKLYLTLAALALSLITFAPTASGQQKTCSCVAPDKLCDIKEIRCPHGCTAVCAPDQACFATCRNNKKDREHARITIKIERTHTTEQIENNLSSASGRRIKFTPRVEGLTFQLDRGPLWDALLFLSKNGEVSINGIAFGDLQKMRAKMKRRQKIGAINYNGIPVNYALADLSFISGQPIRAKSGNAETLLSIALPDATLEEVLSRITKETGVKIEHTGETVSAN